VVRGDPGFAADVTAAVRAAALGGPPASALAAEVRAMREKLEANASPRSLKRCPGGIIDVEFVVQLLQLKYGRDHPDILAPNVWDALDRLEACGLLKPAEAAALRDGYSFLRLVEARLRVVTDRPLNEVPAADDDRAKLARRLGFDADRFLAELRRVTAQVRQLYAAVLRREADPDSG
jgi:glutamate-ammonia-ligase adenylyltransferase